MTKSLTIESRVHFGTRQKGRKELRAGSEQPAQPAPPPGRVPRIARLMALAIRFDGLIRSGQVASYAELARLGRVTRARMTQIMNLLNLAPDIQEMLLFLPRTTARRDSITLRQLQGIATKTSWTAQQQSWRSFIASGPA